MEAVFAVIALLFVLFVALGVYATVKVVGAAKRSADRHIHQARRTVEDHTLRAKAFAQTGPAGEIAQLRLKLRTSMRATQDALEAVAAEDGSVKESLALFQRLSAHGHELDAELRRLEGSRTARHWPRACPTSASAPSASPAPPTPCAGPPATAPAASRTTTSTR